MWQDLAVPDNAMGIQDPAAPGRVVACNPIRQHPLRQFAAEPQRLSWVRLGWRAVESRRSVRWQRGLVIEEG